MRVEKKPYFLVLASHKGGTGRTTTALALTWLWGQAGIRVALVDADPSGAARLIAQPPQGECPWANVRFFAQVPESSRGLLDRDVVILDAPPLGDRAAQRLLRLANGVLLTCSPDSLSLRSLPGALASLQQARKQNARFESLGVIVGNYDEKDRLQRNCIAQFREGYGNAMLDPPVPYQREIAEWALLPGSPLPPGPAAESFLKLGSMLESIIGQVAAV